MYQHDIRMPFGEYTAHTNQYAASNIRKILPGLHQIEIKIWLNKEKIQNLIQHLAMLSCYTNPRLKTVVLTQCRNYRRHLDCLGSGTKNGQDSHINLKLFNENPSN